MSGFGQYRWKLFSTFTYSLPGISVGIQWQHLPHIGSGTTNSGYAAYDVFALNTSYALTHSLTLRFGVDNLFDKSPPFGNVNPNPIAPAFQLPGGGINSNNYDVIGRRFYFGVNAKF